MSSSRAVVAALVLCGGVVAGCGSATSGTSGDGPCDEPTIEGTDGADVLRGTPGDDVITGGDGDDRILGGGGDDLICGGAGADRLDGGAGDDELHGGADKREAADSDYYEWYGDTLAGGPGDDLLAPEPTETDETVVGPDAIDFRRSGHGVEVDLAADTATGEGADRIEGDIRVVHGSAHADVLLGSAGDDQLEGHDGPDRIVGRAGDDTLHAGGGLAETNGHHDRTANVLIGDAGKDALDGSTGDDRLVGGADADTLGGSRGNDVLLAGPGNDQLVDEIEPGAHQRLVGGTGRDDLSEWFLAAPRMQYGDVVTELVGVLSLRDGAMRSTIDGEPVVVPVLGVESAAATYGSWTLIGTDGPNSLTGGFDDAGPSTVRGLGGDDEISGTFGFDDLDGGPGRDTLFTGPGGDRVTGFEKRY